MVDEFDLQQRSAKRVVQSSVSKLRVTQDRKLPFGLYTAISGASIMGEDGAVSRIVDSFRKCRVFGEVDIVSARADQCLRASGDPIGSVEVDAE